MYSSLNGRNSRNKAQMYHPMQMHNPYANYSTEAFQKSDMKLNIENEIFLNNLHLYPDPLKKNLADTLLTSEKPEKLRKSTLDAPTMPSKAQDARADSALAGITTFFSGFVNMLSGVMFRTKSPAEFYDCYEESRQGSPHVWQPSKIDVQDKNGPAHDKLSSDALPNETMNTVTTCEEKLNSVKCLLKNPNPKAIGDKTNWRKRPKKVFVEPGSVEESFEDAFSPEDFVSLSKDAFIEHYSPIQLHNEDKSKTIAAKTKTEEPIPETTEIVNHINKMDNQTIDLNVQVTKDREKTKDHEHNKDVVEHKKVTTDIVQHKESTKDVVEHKKDTKDIVHHNETTKDVVKHNENTKDVVEHNKDTKEPGKHELVIACEDKLSKLKALLQNKGKKNNVIESTPAPIEHRPAKAIPIIKPVDKHFKNPCRMLDKRRKMKMKNIIQDDANFASEISESPDDSPIISSSINSSDTSLGEYFDELKGRFRTTSATESEDSFQIVFHEPKRNSDCDSEDSFIVFEDSPECYTSNDVFGDSDSELSDSGCSTMKLSHSLSRTVSNLTDDTLFESGDEVDCARVKKAGLLLDANKKILRKDQPAKKVHFSTEPPTVKVMRVWAFASRQARAGHWERFALDRERFKRRIADVDMAVSWVLKPQHRSRVMFQRFMPWWNKQKRKEIAEKKEAKRQEEELATLNADANGISDIEEDTCKDEEVDRRKEIDDKIANNYETDNCSMSEYLKYRNEGSICDKIKYFEHDT